MQDISSQAPKNYIELHWQAEDSLTVNMGPAAAGLNQQGHTELHKRLWACAKARNRHFERALR